MSKIEACSSVDRASDSDSESQGFDSLHAYKVKFKKFKKMGLLWFRHLNFINIRIKSKFIIFEKKYKNLK